MSQIGIKLFGQQQQTSIPYLSSRMCPRSSLKGFYFDIQGVNQSRSACKLSHCHRWDCLKKMFFHLPSCCLNHTLFLFESQLKMSHVFLGLLKENKNFKHTLGMLNREPHLKEKNPKTFHWLSDSFSDCNNNRPNQPYKERVQTYCPNRMLTHVSKREI